ncbi:MAG: RNase adapter RapZ [Actinobacteria bacterium]|nr:RNase adapter RapZ [Actinomycetota bacterium]MCG2788776.1 RNase adapter RapZ [Actinomycetes bacterium]
MEEQYSGKLIIITGLSGAGKTAALRYFEDAGYYCVDNLPASLLLNLIGFFAVKDKDINKIAVAIDLRSGDLFNEIYNTLENLKKQKINYKVLFFEAAKSIIMKRFSLTRRKHPLVVDGDILSGIEKETEKLYYLREMSDVIIDTTSLSPRELKIEIAERMMSKEEKSNLFQISLVSFGYKFGISRESLDIVMDVRFLPNPYYLDDLKSLDGKHEKVINFVMTNDESKKFLRMFEKMLDFLIPNYIEEGKSYLGIGIGCTGGRHRSVVIADILYDYLKLKGYSVKLSHKDIDKGE